MEYMRCHSAPVPGSTLSRTLHFAFIFEVVIIRYDNVAHDRGTVHMIVTRARTSLDRT